MMKHLICQKWCLYIQPLLIYKQILSLQISMGNKSQKVVEAGGDERVEWNHDMMKELVIKKDKRDGKQIMEATFAMNNKKDYEAWVKLLNKNPAANSQIAFNPLQHSFHSKGACGSGGMAKIQYQSSPYMLLSEIYNRKINDFKHFDQCQLWYLLYSLSSIANCFHNASEKVGDIRSSNVFMTSDGNVVVAHQYSWPGQKYGYTKSLHHKEVTYLAPEEVIDLQIGRPQSIADLRKSESFSVGLTMLDAALLENCSRLYGKQMSIDFQTLNIMKQNLKNTSYSVLFKHVILNLVSGQPKNRIELRQLTSWLGPHEDKIVNLQPFTVDGLYPMAINETARENPIRQRNLQFTYNQPQHHNIDYSFKNQNRNQDVSIINQGLAGVISGGTSQLDNRNQYSEEKSQFQRKIQQQQQQINYQDTPKFSRMTNQMPQPSFVLQSNIINRPQIIYDQPYDAGSNYQRLHSPQFRPVSNIPRTQFQRPNQFQQHRASQPFVQRNFVSPPPRIQMAHPINFPVQGQPIPTINNRQRQMGTYFARPQQPRQFPQMESIRRQQSRNTFEQAPSYSQPIITEQRYEPSHNNNQFMNRPLIQKQPSRNYSPQKNQSSHFEPEESFDPQKYVGSQITPENKKNGGDLIQAIQERIRSSRENFPSY